MNARDKELWSTVCQSEMPELDETCMTLQRQTKFAELIRADEREACAKVCYAVMKEYDPFSNQANAARNCAADIRARGNV